MRYCIRKNPAKKAAGYLMIGTIYFIRVHVKFRVMNLRWRSSLELMGGILKART